MMKFIFASVFSTLLFVQPTHAQVNMCGCGPGGGGGNVVWLDSTSGVYKDQDGDYVICATINYMATTTMQISAEVYHETLGDWISLREYPDNATVITVPPGFGTIYLYNNVARCSTWGQYIADNFVESASIALYYTNTMGFWEDVSPEWVPDTNGVIPGNYGD